MFRGEIYISFGWWVGEVRKKREEKKRERRERGKEKREEKKRGWYRVLLLGNGVGEVKE